MTVTKSATENIAEIALYLVFFFFLCISVKAEEVWTQKNDIFLGRMRTDLCSISYIARPLKRLKKSIFA